MTTTTAKPSSLKDTATAVPPQVSTLSATSSGAGQTTNTEQAIRDLAYSKWEAAGYPPGDGVQYWLDAESELLGK